MSLLDKALVVEGRVFEQSHPQGCGEGKPIYITVAVGENKLGMNEFTVMLPRQVRNTFLAGRRLRLYIVPEEKHEEKSQVNK